MTAEAETGVLWPQARGHLESPEPGRGRRDPPLKPSERAWSFGHLDSRLPGFTTRNEQTSVVFSSQLWGFVVPGVLGNSHGLVLKADSGH